jgi:hypothetical protein
MIANMRRPQQVFLIAVLFSVGALCSEEVFGMNPLRVFEKNPRYFTDGSGKAVYLTGSHTWTNFMDGGMKDPPPIFDYVGYLEFLHRHKHNFFRLWNWEQAKWAPATKDDVWLSPSAYRRPGPRTALDGKPRFDLTQFDEGYFSRLRQRVMQAGVRDIYVSVMLFNGFSVECKEIEEETESLAKVKRTIRSWWNDGNPCKTSGNPWRGHPFNRNNNMNGIDGDLDGDGEGKEVHTLRNPEITRIQEKYVMKVIDTLNDLPNVLWEISNESHSDSIGWQYRMIGFIKKYECEKPYQHPVGMTIAWPGGKNSDLFDSLADWISPNDQGLDSYKETPPVANGRKVILTDTDHLWGIGGDHKWVWKSFLRGLNPIFMDPYTIPDFQKHPSQPAWDLVRKNMGYTRNFANKLHLGELVPRPDLASSGFCMAEEGRNYLVYAPGGKNVAVNLSGASGVLHLEWFDPRMDETESGISTTGGGTRSFRPPFADDAILYIHGKETK